MRHAGKYLFPIIVMLGTAACSVDRGGLGVPDTEFSAEPNQICSNGEVTVHVQWDRSDLPRRRKFCTAPDGGYSERTSCSTSSDCPPDGSCVDGLCLRDGVAPENVDFGDGCHPFTSTTVTASPAVPIEPPVRRVFAISGSREVPVSQSTTFHGRFWTFKGERDSVFHLETASRDVTTVSFDRTTPYGIEFPPPACENASANVSGRLKVSPNVRLVAHEDVEIVRTINQSGYPITVSYVPRPGATLGPVDLEDLEETEEFNTTPNGVWTASARLDELDTPDVGLPVGDCVTAAGGDSIPPIRLRVDLQCTEPPDDG